MTEERSAAVERLEADRIMRLPAGQIFEVLTDPWGHVDIDSTGMLQTAEGERVHAVGDTFIVRMDRESLGDLPMGRYGVTVTIEDLVPERSIHWSILGTVRPGMGHTYGYELRTVPEGTRVTSVYDWSAAPDEWRTSGVFPVVPEAALRGTLGILERVARRRGE